MQGTGTQRNKGQGFEGKTSHYRVTMGLYGDNGDRGGDKPSLKGVWRRWFPHHITSLPTPRMHHAVFAEPWKSPPYSP